MENLVIGRNALGIQPTEMQRLGSVVCLVGANGAGKSRLLNIAFENAPEPKLLCGPGIFKLAGPGVEESTFDAILHESARLAQQSELPFLKERMSDFTNSKSESFGRIKNFVNQLCGMKLGWKSSEESSIEVLARINGRLFSSEEMSQGQIAVLSAGLFDERAASLEPFHLFIDEPELHLHPITCINLMRELRRWVGRRGQLWIATHSISILSELHPSELWVLVDGRVMSPSISRVDSALVELLGTDMQRENLQLILSEPAKRAAYRFAAESIISPSVIKYRVMDPQSISIRTCVEEKEPLCGKRIRVLDVGAGLARLATVIRLEERLRSRIEYYAYEPDCRYQDNVKKELRSLHDFDPESSPRDTPVRRISDAQVDVVVLCNVLHEVDPVRWCDLFSEVSTALRGSGSLLILEDLHIPASEFAHRFGFLLMSPIELSVLFRIKESQIFVHENAEESYKERLMCAEIRGADVGRVTRVSVIRSIKGLRNNRKKDLRAIRRCRGALRQSAQEGRELALIYQLIVNSDLALDSLSVRSVRRTQSLSERKGTDKRSLRGVRELS